MARPDIIPDVPGPRYPLDLPQEEAQVIHRGESTQRAQSTSRDRAELEESQEKAGRNEDQIAADLGIIFSALEGFDL